MKRFTTVLLGTALAAALSFGAQTSNPPVKAPAMTGHTATTTATKAKKHKKHHSVKKVASANPASTAAKK